MSRVAAAASLIAALLAAGCAGHQPGAHGEKPTARRARQVVPPTYPFAPPRGLRAPTARDALPSLWADGKHCSIDCRAPGAVRGWPIRPFHQQHVLRAGLDELRPGSFHVGVDILAPDGTRAYALEPGNARILAAAGPDARVQVGRFIYWHIHPTVAEGQYVRAYSQVVGTTRRGAAHLHISEVLPDGSYLNPLRPGGRVLSPWRDVAPPVLGRLRFLSGGRVLVEGFDPQSFSDRRYEAPVLGLAGLAYRLFRRDGRPLGRLEWALRATHQLPTPLRRVVYARGSRAAPAYCAGRRPLCRSRWVYRLAGGLAPRLRARLAPGTRLTAYAWDWAGNARAIDARVPRSL